MVQDAAAGRRPISFGYFLVPDAGDPLLDTAAHVERLGLEYVGVQDHPYQRRYVDTWALLAAIAATTTRLRVFPDVSNLPLRPPAVMAKAAATIGLLSQGRFDLGLGAGAFWEAIAAYGGQRRTPGESLAALEEAITVVRKIWSGERGLRFDGSHYRLAGAHGGPAPTEPIGIWIGAYGPRALALTARAADGWVPSFRGDRDNVAQLGDMTRRLDDALAAAGRATAPFRRVLNISGTITTGASDGPLQGPVDQWIDEITELSEDYRFDTFLLWNEDMAQLDRFANEVVPELRQRTRRE